jgi:hypothetical protein
LLTADLATGLTTALTKDGQTTPTANIPMGSFKITGLGAGTSATDAAQYGQLQAGATTIATVTGTDTLTGSVTPALAAYATGNLFSFVAASTNTGAATINLNSLGAKNITKQGTTALIAGDIASGRVHLIEYDGTRFQLLNPASSTGTGASVFATSPTLVTPTLGVATATSLQGIIGNVTPAAGTFTTVTGSNDASINGLTVGRGAGAVATNTAVGASALQANSSGLNGTVLGYQAGYTNTTGNSLTAIGYQAGYSNLSGSGNLAIGQQALYYNSVGTSNVAVGQTALQNTTASNNTAVGYQAGYTNTTNGANAFFGGLSGYNSTGVTNTYIGYGAGYSMTSGGKNAIIGGYNGNQGGLDIRTASNYIVLSDGDGNPLISTNSTRSVALNGAVPQTGTGITFPATQSASTDANTLDDYEEGTWTPTDGSGAGLSFTSVYGSYTKIGRTVVATFRLTYPSTSSTAAGAISGLPFVTGGQSGVGATAGGGFINYQQTNTAAIYLTLDASGGTKASWYTTGGATILNVTFTGALMAATIVYQTT